MGEQIYPIGEQSFSEIRSSNKTYVDKTMFIPLLLRNKFYFLGRPRRFGKSLFLSTLENFFYGRRELFSGLAIEDFQWDWEQYPVVRIDLGPYDFTSPDSLEEVLSSILAFHEEKYGIKNQSNNLSIRFGEMLRALARNSRKQVVVLVDEYDKPVIDLLHDKSLQNKYLEILRGFYSVLKSNDEYLRLVFLTGVSRFGKMSIFSGLNNVSDISMNEEYASICGITENEMRTHIGKGIENLAQRMNLDFEGACQLLKENYDGYHFTAQCPDIYNPYSLFNALSNCEIEDYWFRSGTPGLLIKVLNDSHYNLEELSGSTAEKEDLLGIDTTFHDPVPLFYQTGYLTIKSYNPITKTYLLDFPNKEVANAFFKFILPYYTGRNKRESINLLNQLNTELENGNPDSFIRLLIAFTSEVNYDIIPAKKSEQYFQNLIYTISRLLAMSQVRVEKRTSNGRIDMLIETNHYVYIIEIKFDSTSQNALKQIKEKEYWKPFMGDTRKVFLIGLNFSREERALDADFSIEEYFKNC